MGPCYYAVKSINVKSLTKSINVINKSNEFLLDVIEKKFKMKYVLKLKELVLTEDNLEIKSDLLYIKVQEQPSTLLQNLN